MTNSSLALVIEATAGMDMYDSACKLILSQRQVIARILKECLPEYASCPIDDIAYKYLVEDPLRSKISLDEAAGSVWQAENESPTLFEGRTSFDIVTQAALPTTGDSVGIIIDVEPQGYSTSPRELMRRAAYYCARLISSQRNRVFKNMDYGKMHKVCSIWVLLNPHADQRNSITRVHFTKESLVGSPVLPQEAIDLIDIVIIGLGDPEKAGYTGVLGLLDTILSKDVTADEKRHVLTDEYGIDFSDDLEGGIGMIKTISEMLQEQYLAQLEADVKEQVEVQVKAKVQEELEARVQERLQEELEARVQEQLEERLEARVQERLQEELEARVQEQLEERLEARVQEQLEERLEARVQEQFEALVQEQVEARVREMREELEKARATVRE